MVKETSVRDVPLVLALLLEKELRDSEKEVEVTGSAAKEGVGLRTEFRFIEHNKYEKRRAMTVGRLLKR